MANVLPDEDAVLQTVHARVFRQGLVEAAHWSQKNYGIDTVKVGAPGVSLSPDRVLPSLDNTRLLRDGMRLTDVLEPPTSYKIQSSYLAPDKQSGKALHWHRKSDAYP